MYWRLVTRMHGSSLMAEPMSITVVRYGIQTNVLTALRIPFCGVAYSLHHTSALDRDNLTQNWHRIMKVPFRVESRPRLPR